MTLGRGPRLTTMPDPHLLGAIRADPNSEEPCLALAGWYGDHGYTDIAVAIRVFWETLADSLHVRQSLDAVLDDIRRNERHFGAPRGRSRSGDTTADATCPRAPRQSYWRRHSPGPALARRRGGPHNQASHHVPGPRGDHARVWPDPICGLQPEVHPGHGDGPTDHVGAAAGQPAPAVQGRPNADPDGVHPRGPGSCRHPGWVRLTGKSRNGPSIGDGSRSR